MWFDLSLTLAAAFTQLLMTVMGFWWSLRPPKPRHHRLAAGAFAAAGLIGMGAVIWAGVRGITSSSHIEKGIGRIEQNGSTQQNNLTQQHEAIRTLQSKIDAQSQQLSSVQHENENLGIQNNRLLNQNTMLDADLKKIANAANVNPDLSAETIADAISRKLVPTIHEIEGGSTYTVPNSSCIVNVKTTKTTPQTDVYLPQHPFKGETIEVQNVPIDAADSSGSPIVIHGNGHKILTREITVIVSAGGAQKMVFDGTRWSATGVM